MKHILDPCCGSRMFWFDKQNPDVVFADNRYVNTTLCDGRELVIEPDMEMDFRDMPFPDNTFDKVIEELREMQSHSKLCKNQCGFTSTEYFDYMGAEVAYGTAIEIVEKGGIE